MPLQTQRSTPRHAFVPGRFSRRKTALSPRPMALLFGPMVALLLTLFMLTGCTSPTGQGSGNISGIPTVSPPTATDTIAQLESTSTAVPPAPTAPLPPASSLTASSALTVIPVPAEIAGLQATHIARATASPFPTPEPLTVQAGQAETPAMATTRRGGISIELRLEGDTYLAGESGRAWVSVRNDSPAMLFAGNIEFSVRDEQGKEVDPWPLTPGPRAGWPGQYRFGGILRPVEPGTNITSTFTFMLPPPNESKGHSYTARASAQFSRPNIQRSDLSDNVPVDVQTAPISLRVVEPKPEQRLKAEWQANRQGYTLRVTDAEGKPVAGPLWGAIEVSSGRGSMSGPLQDSVSGTWSSGWAEFLTQDGTPLQVRAWVAARGYLPATIEETVPGTRGGSGEATPPAPFTPVPTAQPVLAPTSLLTVPEAAVASST